MPKEMKYEEAVRQLEEIVAKMESNELDVDSLSHCKISSKRECLQ